MKYLITGISGFVGGHYVEYLLNRDLDSEIIGVDIYLPQFYFLENRLKKKVEFYRKSILDKKFILKLVKRTKPDYIVNLASYSSVAYSWVNPVECFVNNTNIFLNIIEAVRESSKETKILSIGSSEEYGAADGKDIPLTEKVSFNPTSPYAVARVAQEQISGVYSAGYDIGVICTRSFNHIGPRQKEVFVVSSLAKQIVEAKKGKRDKIVCGNLDVIRDFIDVRDVVRAYDLLLHKGKVGEVYNVCSGEGHKLSAVLELLQEKAETNIFVEVDPVLMRPVENPVIIGSYEKLQKDTGFQKEYTFSRSLAEVLDYWQRQV